MLNLSRIAARRAKFSTWSTISTYSRSRIQTIRSFSIHAQTFAHNPVFKRQFQNLAPKSDDAQSVPTKSSALKTSGNLPEPPSDIPSRAEQRRSDWSIIKRLLVNVWPKNDWKTRSTVLFGFGLLVTAKVRQYPFVIGGWCDRDSTGP